jgi:hypothetical protein
METKIRLRGTYWQCNGFNSGIAFCNIEVGGQDKFFFSFNLDSHVPQSQLLRGIDRFLDLRDLRQHIAPFYSPMGRPSIDPELKVRMLMRGLLFWRQARPGRLTVFWQTCRIVAARAYVPACFAYFRSRLPDIQVCHL